MINNPLSKSIIDNIQGGTETLQSISDELGTQLDLAENSDQSGTYSIDSGDGTISIYNQSSIYPMFFAGGMITSSGITGNVTLAVTAAVDGTNDKTLWQAILTSGYNNQAIGIPCNDPSSATGRIPQEFYVPAGVDVKVNLSSNSATPSIFYFFMMDAQR